jgi:hypothetical protein
LSAIEAWIAGRRYGMRSANATPSALGDVDRDPLPRRRHRTPTRQVPRQGGHARVSRRSVSLSRRSVSVSSRSVSVSWRMCPSVAGLCRRESRRCPRSARPRSPPPFAGAQATYLLGVAGHPPTAPVVTSRVRANGITPRRRRATSTSSCLLTGAGSAGPGADLTKVRDGRNVLFAPRGTGRRKAPGTAGDKHLIGEFGASAGWRR